jgi:hypothetical protein
MSVATEQLTLWTMSQGGQRVECAAATHPLGVELRYIMNQRLLMSRVFDSWERLTGQAHVWREGLQIRGWIEGTVQGRYRRR